MQRADEAAQQSLLFEAQFIIHCLLSLRQSLQMDTTDCRLSVSANVAFRWGVYKDLRLLKLLKSVLLTSMSFYLFKYNNVLSKNNWSYTELNVMPFIIKQHIVSEENRPSSCITYVKIIVKKQRPRFWFGVFVSTQSVKLYHKILFVENVVSL